VDQGVIASMMSHPLEGAIVLLDPEGHPLAANATARTLDLPRGLQLHRLALLGLRDRVADQGLLPCSVPVGEQRVDGFLSAARAQDGTVCAYIFSAAPAASLVDGRWPQLLHDAGHGVWEWDVPAHLLAYLERSAGAAPVTGTVHEWLQRTHPDDRAMQQAALRSHLRDPAVAYACRLRVRRADGGWQQVHDHGQVVARTADDQALRMAGIRIGITSADAPGADAQEQQAQLRHLQRIAALGTWSWERDSGFSWSDEMLAAIGRPPGSMPPGRRWLDMLDADARAQVLAAWRRLHREGQPHAFELVLAAAPMEVPGIHLRVWMHPRHDASGRVRRVAGQLQNVTEQRQTDALIRWRTELLNRVSALGRIGGCEIEVTTRGMLWTDECYRIHGLRKEPVTLEQTLALYTPDSRDSFEAALTRIAEGGLPEQLDLCFYRHSGQRVWVQVQIELDRREGLPERFVVLFRDITREREANERIELLAHYDLLTGLPNRILLREQTEEAIAESRRNGKILAMLFVDLDGFKSINDTFGHATGDMLLKAAAARLHQNLRNADLFGRFNGDEFVVVLRHLADPADAGHVARKLIASLASPLHRGDTTLKVGASVGIALADDSHRDFDTLLRAADAAMHAAKEAGRNTYQYYSQDVLAGIQRRLQIEHALHGALEREEFQLVYQPLVNVDGTRPPAIEALLRWVCPELGPCSPAEFIPVAEKCGEITRIGEWVLNEACRQAAAWHAAGLMFERIAVNVSAMQLRERGFAEQVIAICERHRWPPHRLELELTESALIRDSDALRQCFDTFERNGVLLAVDDFGTGFSNLHYLNRFPVQRLKIDRSFVQRMLHDAGTAEVTQAIVHLGHALGMQVVAEGVETRQEEAMLLRQGCDEIQGYLYSRPLPSRDMAQWLRRCDEGDGPGPQAPTQADLPATVG